MLLLFMLFFIRLVDLSIKLVSYYLYRHTITNLERLTPDTCHGSVKSLPGGYRNSYILQHTPSYLGIAVPRSGGDTGFKHIEVFGMYNSILRIYGCQLWSWHSASDLSTPEIFRYQVFKAEGILRSRSGRVHN